MSLTAPFPCNPLPALAMTGVSGISFNGATGECVAAFNVPPDFPFENVVGADPTKWTARIGNNRYTGTGVANEGTSELRLTFGGGAPEVGANEISYTNAPSDISDTAGRPLPAFTFVP